MVTLKWSVLTTSRRHNLGRTEPTLATYLCTERLSYFQVNLYPSCPLLYITTGGIMTLLWSLGISLKCFWKKWIHSPFTLGGRGYGSHDFFFCGRRLQPWNDNTYLIISTLFSDFLNYLLNLSFHSVCMKPGFWIDGVVTPLHVKSISVNPNSQ